MRKGLCFVALALTLSSCSFQSAQSKGEELANSIKESFYMELNDMPLSFSSWFPYGYRVVILSPFYQDRYTTDFGLFVIENEIDGQGYLDIGFHFWGDDMPYYFKTDLRTVECDELLLVPGQSVDMSSASSVDDILLTAEMRNASFKKETSEEPSYDK